MDCWTIKFEPIAEKRLKKLDKRTARVIQNYINTRIITNPKLSGKALTGSQKGLWRYRIGKYRIICRIRDNILTVIVLEIGKRD